MRMFLFFSHKLTPQQIEDAKKLGVEEFVSLPDDLQAEWSNVPPEIESLDEYAGKFVGYLNENAKEGDYVLIQGDFGMCCKIAGFCKGKGFVPVYATTKRVAREIKKDNKIVKVSEFKHVRFRKY